MTDQHILQETFDSLPKLDYIPLLDAILKELKTTTTPIFQLSPDQNRLLIRAYDFAYKIATENKTLNPLTQTTESAPPPLILKILLNSVIKLDKFNSY